MAGTRVPAPMSDMARFVAENAGLLPSQSPPGEGGSGGKERGHKRAKAPSLVPLCRRRNAKGVDATAVPMVEPLPAGRPADGAHRGRNAYAERLGPNGKSDSVIANLATPTGAAHLGRFASRSDSGLDRGRIGNDDRAVCFTCGGDVTSAAAPTCPALPLFRNYDDGPNTVLTVERAEHGAPSDYSGPPSATHSTDSSISASIDLLGLSIHSRQSSAGDMDASTQCFRHARSSGSQRTLALRCRHSRCAGRSGVGGAMDGLARLPRPTKRASFLCCSSR